MTSTKRSRHLFEPLPANTVLARAGSDLSVSASAGELAPAFGVEETIAQMARALMRSDKGSIVLLGPAGVGKSACVEEFCRLQVAGKLPEPLASRRVVRISFLDVAGLQPAGSEHNDYPNYLRRFLVEVAEYDVLVFLDEVQSLAYWPITVQTIKPLLARGQLRIIAATTPAEYDQFIRRDPALERRFQIVQVHEPSEVQLRRIIQGAAPKLEARFNVAIGDDVIDACIRMSGYLPQHQPDAALDLLELAAIEAAGVGVMIGDEEDGESNTLTRTRRQNANPAQQAG